MEISDEKLQEFIDDLQSLHQHAKRFNKKWVDSLGGVDNFDLTDEQAAKLTSVYDQHEAFYESIGAE